MIDFVTDLSISNYTSSKSTKRTEQFRTQPPILCPKFIY